MNTPDLQLLAHELAATGFVGHDAAIASVSRSARAAGISPVLVDVLADPAAPEVARLRAFGMIATRLAQAAPAQPERVRALAAVRRPTTAAA
jgi:hypothetical protein